MEILGMLVLTGLSLLASVLVSMKRRLMALMLLHRASDPVRHICIEDGRAKPTISCSCRS
jgi:hypothetical protein